MQRAVALPGLYEGMALVALIVSPFVSFILPASLASRQILPHTDWKDAINIALIAGYATIIVGRMLFANLLVLLRWGACYRHVEHNYFYQEDGTVLVRSTFHLVAGWKEPIEELPREELLWFSDIDRDKIHYRLVQRGTVAARRISGALPDITPSQLVFERADMTPRAVSWRPKISPPLRRKESLVYQVEILTPGTEKAAFEPGGTTMGFGIALPTSSVSLSAYAPIGYQFDLLEPSLTMRDYTALTPVPGTRAENAPPELSPDGTIVTLARVRPRAGKRTWIHYRFERLDGVVARVV
jgi:hypothetical protein